MAGRPTKYKEEYVELAYKACADLGADDKGLAKFFNTTVTSINTWKIKYPDFLASIKKGKAEYDTNEVKVALRKRAIGYSHPDIHIQLYKGKPVITEITKHYPPDVTACIFWLCNRDPENWKSINKSEVQFTGDTNEHLKKVADAISKSDTDSK